MGIVRVGHLIISVFWPLNMAYLHVRCNSMATYTAEDLVRITGSEGFGASARLIDDWVAKGLLDRPTKRGLGRGRGTVATWPENQLRLLRVLLQKRREVMRVTTLCNIPVLLWLLWGDPYAPLRQVRRALMTWCSAYRRGSWTPAQQTARNVLRTFDHPHARKADRDRLVEVLAESAVRGTVDRTRLLDAFKNVFDPHNEGREIGPANLRVTPEGYLTLLEARLAGIQALPKLEDEIFRLARDVFRQNLAAYTKDQPFLAADPDVGHMFEAPVLERLANEACLTLLTTIGALVRAGQRGFPNIPASS
jgi:hypothetical protein